MEEQMDKLMDYDIISSCCIYIFKGMPDDRQNWPILSANKIGQKIYLPSSKNRPIIVQHITRSILDDKIGQLFGYRSPW